MQGRVPGKRKQFSLFVCFKELRKSACGSFESLLNTKLHIFRVKLNKTRRKRNNRLKIRKILRVQP